jgi:hypothetical protein
MERVSRMSEFIYMLLLHADIDAEKFYKTKLKGDIETAKEIKALKIASAAYRASSFLERAQIVFNVYKTAPAMINSPIVRRVFNLGVDIHTMKTSSMPFSYKELAVDGTDLISAGISKGPLLGRVLQHLLVKVYCSILPNEKSALINHLKEIAFIDKT